MKTIIYAIALFVIGCFWGCRNEEKATEKKEINFSTTKEIVRLNGTAPIIKTYDYKEALLDTICKDISYINIPTEGGYIATVKEIITFDSLIYIHDYKMDAVLIMDSKGRYVKRIRTLGRGPKEYIGLGGIAIDYQKKELMLSDRLSPQILYYDLKGEFKRKEKLNLQYSRIFPTSTDSHIYFLRAAMNKNIPELTNYSIIFTQGDSVISKGLENVPIQTSFFNGARFKRSRNSELLYQHTLTPYTA